MEVKLYVGNLSYQTTDDDLRTLFAQAGTVASVEAQNAISLFNNYQLGERPLKVNLAKPREERSSGYRRY